MGQDKFSSPNYKLQSSQIKVTLKIAFLKWKFEQTFDPFGP